MAPPPPPADDENVYGIVTPMAPEPEYSEVNDSGNYGAPVFAQGSSAPQQQEENIYGMATMVPMAPDSGAQHDDDGDGDDASAATATGMTEGDGVERKRPARRPAPLPLLTPPLASSPRSHGALRLRGCAVGRAFLYRGRPHQDSQEEHRRVV